MVAAGAIETEETLVIETPERVPLHFALASIGNRFLACTVDHALQLLLALLAFIFFSIIGEYSSVGAAVKEAPKWVQAILIIVIFLIWTSYFIFFEWLWNGQTPGKRWLRLRVIREDGRPVTFWEAMVRNLIRIFDMMPLPFYSIGLISVFISHRDQRIGDMIAGSVVVREREEEAPTFDNVFATPVSDTALRRSFREVQFTAAIERLTASEIEVVETFLRRRWDLPDMTRATMAWRSALPFINTLP